MVPHAGSSMAKVLSFPPSEIFSIIQSCQSGRHSSAARVNDALRAAQAVFCAALRCHHLKLGTNNAGSTKS